MVGVQQWAEIRRAHFVEGVGIRALARKTGLDRKTIRRALRSDEPPRYERTAAGSKLDPYTAKIHELLKEHPDLPGKRIFELIGEAGYEGSTTILYDYLRDVRPYFGPRARTFQRTTYTPGEICQFDLWEPSREIPVGHGQTRRGYVVIACLGYSRVGAGALIFSTASCDILYGITRCLWRLGGLPKKLVWDRQGALHADDGRPTRDFAELCGRLSVGWRFCEANDPQAKGVVERLQGYIETNFEPGRTFVNEHDFQDRLDAWFEEKANLRTHRTLRCRPIDRLPDEHEAMRDLPVEMPDLDQYKVIRVPPDPYVRVDTCDYSLDPRLVGRRVQVRIAQRKITAAALDSGELVANHRRSFARHRTITDQQHLRMLRALRRAHTDLGDVEVEQRSLERYDALIPA